MVTPPPDRNDRFAIGSLFANRSGGGVKDIVEAIRRAERGTTGEIRVHLARRAHGDALDEAKRMFVKLGMQKTAARNAVLILVRPADHSFAIIGDEGIHAKVGSDFWDRTRDAMLARFRQGQLREGILSGVREVGSQLKAYFPARGANPNELSDTVTEG